MENKYAIINIDTIQTRINKLLVEAKELLEEDDLEWREEFLNYKDYSPDFEEYSDNSKYFYIIMGKIETYQELLFQSIPLLPEIEKAFNAGVISNSSDQYIMETKLSKQDYIDNFKLEI